jgi:N-acetylmuramoyl-L-alanine amidase
MRDWRWGWSFLLAVLLPAALIMAAMVPLVRAGLAAAPDRPAVLDVRLGIHPDKTRVVLDLTGEPGYRIFPLSEPYRMVLDLTEVDWRLPDGHVPVGRGLVQSLRYGLFAPGTSRVVLDLTGPTRVEAVQLLPAAGDTPVRLVIDLSKLDQASFLATLHDAPIVSSATMASPALVAPAALVLPPPKPDTGDSRPLIALDPGHGGVDPGAIGGSGVYEKEITLAMALELKRQLEETGRYRVVLTRDEDVFIRLRDRISVARAAGADLFVSLHADSHGTRDLRGASVYTLSEQASDAEAAALATKENKSDVIAGIDLSNENEVVTNILIDLAQRETKNLSARFAALLVDELKRDTLMLRNSHRFAGFAVLKAPDVPSVLVELGYLSSSADEAELRSVKHRAKLGSAMVRAIDGFFEWQQTMRRP